MCVFVTSSEIYWLRVYKVGLLSRLNETSLCKCLMIRMPPFHVPVHVQLECLAGDLVFQLKCFVIFLCDFRQVLGYKVGYGPHLSSSFFASFKIISFDAIDYKA